MAVLDIIILLCFVPSIVMGLIKGFVVQLVDFAALLIGAWIAFNYSSTAAEWVEKYITLDKTIVFIICFATLLTFSVLLLHLLGKGLTKVIKIATLGWLNALLGLIFGILKTALLLGILCVIFTTLNGKFHFVEAEKLNDAVIFQALNNFASSCLKLSLSKLPPIFAQ